MEIWKNMWVGVFFSEHSVDYRRLSSMSCLSVSIGHEVAPPPGLGPLQNNPISFPGRIL